MQTISTRIADSEKLTALLGSWPAFHDAEIVKVELDREPEPNATFHIHYFDKQQNLLVRLRFVDVEELKFEDFNNQNVLFELRIVDSANRVRVDMSTSHGLHGSFTCQQ